MSLPMLYTVNFISIQEPCTNTMCSKLPLHVGKPSFVLLILMGFFGENNFYFMLNKGLMVCQRLSIVTMWQVIGMNNVGLSCREIGHQLN